MISITINEGGDIIERENDLHIGGVAIVYEGAVHPCSGDRNRNHRGYQEHLCAGRYDDW